MSKTSKLLSVFLVLAMTITTMVSCTPKKQGNTSSGTAKPKITNITWYTAGTTPNQPDAVIKALNAKSAKDIGVTVTFKFQNWQDTALKTALAAGDSNIDIAFSSSSFADYVSSSQNNYFVDLTHLLPKETPKLYKALPAVLWQGEKVGGKIYGVPTWKDTVENLWWVGRKDILEKANAMKEFKATGDSLESATPLLAKIKAWHDADPTKNLYSQGGTAPMNLSKTGLSVMDVNWNMLNEGLGIGIKDIASPNPKVTSIYKDPDMIADYKTLEDWANKGYTNGKQALQIDNSNAQTTIMVGQGWDGAQYTSWGGPSVGFDVLINKYAGPLLKSDSVLGSSNSIALNSKHVDASLKYLEYINTNEAYRNMLAYGIKGKNWEEVDGKYKILTGSDWVTPASTMASFNILLAPVEVPNADMYQKVAAQVNTAPKNDLMGFAPDYSQVQNEVSACNSIIQQNINQLNCGMAGDVDKYTANLTTELDQQGYQKIIDVLQKQVDAFIKTKK